MRAERTVDQVDQSAEWAILRRSREAIMQQVTIHAAKARLSRLIEAALKGEEVIIAKDGKPIVRLAPVQRRRFQVGILAGRLGTLPDFFTPMERSGK